MITSLIVLISLFLFSSCTNTTEEAIEEQKSRVTVDFSTFQVEVEDMSRGSDDPLTFSDVAKRLSFAVFNVQGNQLVGNVINKVNTETDFEKVQLELSPGTYQMVAVAHNGSEDAAIASITSATLPGTTFTDTFAKVQGLTVEDNKDCNFSMTLPRITSAFILKITDTDKVPNGVTKIEVEVNTGGTSLSEVDPQKLIFKPSDGFALNNLKFTYTIPVTELTKTIPFYFIGTTSPTTVAVRATAKAADGTAVISHTIGQIPLVRNQKTVASGKFFTPKVSGAFIVETWGADNNIEY